MTASRITLRRLTQQAIIRPEMDASIGLNINGPSLIRVPDWIKQPLGRYYLYFAHHQGQHIRLAYADELEGPWQIYSAGVLDLEDTACHDHIASPDVHVVDGQIRMYFHGVYGKELNYRGQRSFLALSDDGLSFTARPGVLGPYYMRVFRVGAFYYAIAKRIDAEGGGILLRSQDAVSAFETGPTIIPRMRHAAVLLKGEKVSIFYSRGEDAPEHILVSELDTRADWRNWQGGEPHSLIKPELPFEGALLPVEASRFGAIHTPVHQLRDPAIFQEEGRNYLLYSVAGESGIGIAEMT